MWDGSRVRDPEGAASPFSLLPTVVCTDEVCPLARWTDSTLSPVGVLHAPVPSSYLPFLAVQW